MSILCGLSSKNVYMLRVSALRWRHKSHCNMLGECRIDSAIKKTKLWFYLKMCEYLHTDGEVILYVIYTMMMMMFKWNANKMSLIDLEALLYSYNFYTVKHHFSRCFWDPWKSSFALDVFISPDLLLFLFVKLLIFLNDFCFLKEKEPAWSVYRKRRNECCVWMRTHLSKPDLSLCCQSLISCWMSTSVSLFLFQVKLMQLRSFKAFRGFIEPLKCSVMCMYLKMTSNIHHMRKGVLRSFAYWTLWKMKCMLIK